MAHRSGEFGSYSLGSPTVVGPLRRRRWHRWHRSPRSLFSRRSPSVKPSQTCQRLSPTAATTRPFLQTSIRASIRRRQRLGRRRGGLRGEACPPRVRRVCDPSGDRRDRLIPRASWRYPARHASRPMAALLSSGRRATQGQPPRAEAAPGSGFSSRYWAAGISFASMDEDG